jgi:hypothetical protein
MDISFSIHPLLAGAILIGAIAIRIVHIETNKVQKKNKIKI